MALEIELVCMSISPTCLLMRPYVVHIYIYTGMPSKFDRYISTESNCRSTDFEINELRIITYIYYMRNIYTHVATVINETRKTINY